MSKLSTTLIHSNRKPSENQGCVNNPLFATSTIVFDSFESFIKADNDKILEPNKVYYGRYGSTTNLDCQKLIAKAYGCDFAKITSCGHSASVVAILSFVQSGDEVLVNNNAYQPTRHFINEIQNRFSITATLYNPFDINSIEESITSKTKVLFLESPASLTFEVADIEQICKIAKAKNPQIKIIVDNTFSTPLHHNPFTWGADVVIESATKFFLGFSEYMCGAISYNQKDALALEQSFRLFAPTVSPATAHACLKGLRTLGARLEAHTQTFNYIIPKLKSHSKIKQILHPSIDGTLGCENYKKYFNGAASVFAICLDKVYEDKQLAKFFNSLQFFSMGYSYGGYESLAIPFPKDFYNSRTKGLPSFNDTSNIRIYLGLEDKDDLLNDLLNALDLAFC